MEEWITFVEERWVLIVIALIVLWIIVKIVNSALKWLLVIAILAGLWFYGSNYTDQIKDIGAQFLDFTKAEAVEALFGEAHDAQYEAQENGAFKITTKNFVLEGQTGTTEAKLTFKGQTFSINLNDKLRELIDDVRSNSQG